MRTREENLERLRHSYCEVQPGQKLVVGDFRPEDADGIAKLYYAVYGDGFPVDHVYDPDEIIRLSACNELHYVVGRTHKGDIVGIYGLFRNPPGKQIMEAGGWIVLPSYRNSTLAMRLAQKIHMDPPAHLGLNAIFGQCVCDHVITQKMGVKFNTFYCALEIEAMPPRPQDKAGNSGGRISLLDGIIIIHDAPHGVHLPSQYAGMLREMYASRGLSREFRDDTGPTAACACSVQNMDTASLVKMTVHEPGIDFDAQLERMARDFPGRHVSQLFLPLWRPGMTHAVDTARQAGFFLGGLLPLWDGKDALLMQKIATPPDFSKIQLHHRESRSLLDWILADRASLPSPA